jgi:hypothetical protein
MCPDTEQEKQKIQEVPSSGYALTSGCLPVVKLLDGPDILQFSSNEIISQYKALIPVVKSVTDSITEYLTSSFAEAQKTYEAAIDAWIEKECEDICVQSVSIELIHYKMSYIIMFQIKSPKFMGMQFFEMTKEQSTTIQTSLPTLWSWKNPTPENLLHFYKQCIKILRLENGAKAPSIEQTVQDAPSNYSIELANKNNYDFYSDPLINNYLSKFDSDQIEVIDRLYSTMEGFHGPREPPSTEVKMMYIVKYNDGLKSEEEALAWIERAMVFT